MVRAGIPFFALNEELVHRGLSGTDAFKHKEGAVTVLHGRRLHLVVLSSSRMPEAKAVRFREILGDIDEAFMRRGEDEVILHHDQALVKFELELGRLAGKSQVG